MSDRDKFKVWDKKNKKWITSEIFDEYEYPDEIFLSGKGEVFEVNCEDRYEKVWCTGLRDKTRTPEFPKGKLIFEGDILKGYSEKGWNPKLNATEWGAIGVVEWSCGWHGNPKAEFIVCGWPAYWACISKEVIGNIHENTEGEGE